MRSVYPSDPTLVNNYCRTINSLTHQFIHRHKAHNRWSRAAVLSCSPILFNTTQLLSTLAHYNTNISVNSVADRYSSTSRAESECVWLNAKFRTIRILVWLFDICDCLLVVTSPYLSQTANILIIPYKGNYQSKIWNLEQR